MNILFEIEGNELEKDSENSRYNKLCWKLLKSPFGLTHLYEIYDDVSDYPFYQLGRFIDGKFKCDITGEGDPIEEKSIGFGGAFFQIKPHYPKQFISIAALAAIPVQEPVATVPIHPRDGALWANTQPIGSNGDRPAHYPLMPLYAHPLPAVQTDKEPS